MSIYLRCKVKFKSKHRDNSLFLVMEIRYNGKLLIESLSDGAYYVVGFDDVVNIEELRK